MLLTLHGCDAAKQPILPWRPSTVPRMVSGNASMTHTTANMAMEPSGMLDCDSYAMAIKSSAKPIP